jgi:hypothetical protein
MPSGISNSDLLDLTRTTLANLPDMQFEVPLDFQRYPVCNMWFNREKKQVDSGTSIERNIMLDTSGNARFVRLYQKTPINVTDVQKKITAPWVQVQTHYSIERREALRNRTPARYVSLIQSRRTDATLDLADLLERKAWETPISASDDLNPRGVPYWLSLRNDGNSGQGFDGQTIRYAGGTTSTEKAGLDGSLAANTKWRNYAATYTAINADFVKRMRRAFHATNFRSPMLVKDIETGRNRYYIYMGLDNLTDYEDLATKQNDNLGRDLDPFHGMTTFRRVPIEYTPVLDDFTILDGGDNDFKPSPIFAINHDKFFPIVLEGDFMRESEPMIDVEQHNVQTVFTDSSFQFFCNNVREAGFVMHKVIPSS